MSEDNNNLNNDLSREEINDELNKVKKNNREESFLTSVEDADSYRTSQPDEPGQEKSDERDRNGYTIDVLSCYQIYIPPRNARPSGDESRHGCGCLIWGVIGSLLIIFLLWRTFVPSPAKTTDSPAPSNNKLAMPVDKENAIVNPKTELPVEEHKPVPETIRKEE